MSLPSGSLGPAAPPGNSAITPNISHANRSGGHYLKYLNKYKPQRGYNPAPPRWRQGYESTSGYTNQQLYRPSEIPRQAETSFSNLDTPRTDLAPGIRHRQGYTPIDIGEPDTHIEIPSTFESESAPLLSGATTSASASSAFSAAQAAAGIGAAIGTGFVVKKATDYVDEHGAVLPGSEYIGPFNPIKESPAQSIEDQIARDHDLGYSEVVRRAREEHWSIERFNAEIGHLDETAFNQFWERYSTAGDWKALVGYLGLRGKYALEHYTGKLYPSFPGKINAAVRQTSKPTR